MNGKSFIKNILLIIMILISCIFIFTSTPANTLSGIGTRPLFIPLTIALNLLLLNKNKKTKFKKICLIILTTINSIWLIYHTYELIHYYIKWNYLELDISFIYLITIFTILITSLPDIKKETNKLNDILTIITTLLIILIHYRFYLDQNFLHNLINLNYNSHNLQERFDYITQYYFIFIVMYTSLYIHKTIISINKQK